MTTPWRRAVSWAQRWLKKKTDAAAGGKYIVSCRCVALVKEYFPKGVNRMKTSEIEQSGIYLGTHGEDYES